jgi:ribosomal protein S18 acetylase RimI-like enzyme
LVQPSDVVQIRRLLLRDPIWSVYALADLQPAFAPYCHWSVVQGDNGEAVVLRFTALQPPILFATGDRHAVAEALATTELPERIYVTLQRAHYALLSDYYVWTGDAHPMARMVLRSNVRVVLPETILPENAAVVRLYPDDAEAIAALYRQGGPFTPDAFDPYQLEDGVFYGIKEEQGALSAVGGTHIVAWQERMGAIGNMYTHPAQRGKGYARAVLGAIIAELQARNVTTIVLNVDERNATARGLYERYGFAPYCTYIEAEGVKKNR